MANPARQLVLNKGTQTFVFRYLEGQEGRVIEQLNACVEDKQTDFDAFDAAVLGLKVVEAQAESVQATPAQINRRI
jgi:hypothetical protein